MSATALDKLRPFRPRILVYGPAGSGQAYLGPAILHHLEGYHVQSLDLGSLMGDSTMVRSHHVDAVISRLCALMIWIELMPL